MAEKEYLKLTPARQQSGFAFVSSTRSRLWLGRDHLLLVTTTGYTESYKRFYFADIQAVVLRRTARARIIAMITGSMLAMFLILAFAFSAIEARWVFGILAGVCAIPFVVNALYGPTCYCELRTAVQTEPLPSMSRINRARKVMARLRPLIAAAQGEMSAEDVTVRMRELIFAPQGETESLAAGSNPILGESDAPPRMTR